MVNLHQHFLPLTSLGLARMTAELERPRTGFLEILIARLCCRFPKGSNHNFISKHLTLGANVACFTRFVG